MVLHTQYLSIITLNVNGLNAPTKRHSIAEWIRKQTYIYAASKRPISGQKNTHGPKVKGWKKIFCAKGKKKLG